MTKYECLNRKADENHYFLSEIILKLNNSSPNFPKFILGFSFDVESSCLKIM